MSIERFEKKQEIAFLSDDDIVEKVKELNKGRVVPSNFNELDFVKEEIVRRAKVEGWFDAPINAPVEDHRDEIIKEQADLIASLMRQLDMYRHI